MIKIENAEVNGWEAAIRGMRNPLNSWEKNDSLYCADAVTGEPVYSIGSNDHSLMMKLAKAGSEHAKYRRMITVTCDVTAPLYLWKEIDTFKVGTVCNSCSTMHRIHAKKFEMEDFSFEDVTKESQWVLYRIIEALEESRQLYIETKDKKHWRDMIQILPSSYNQRRTLQLNYEVLANMYRQRKSHKLDEWVDFCSWIETLPYSELITLDDDE